MFYLNIYTRTGQYVCSICQNTRKQCVAIARQKYDDYNWDWDDKNHVKHKKFVGDASTEQRISLQSLLD